VTAPVQDPVTAQVAAAALGAAMITSQVSQTTAQLIANLFLRINPYSAKEVRDFAKQAGRIIVGSQRTVANAHTAAQLLQLRAMGINQAVPVVIPDNVRGASVTFGGGKPKVHAPTETTVPYNDGAEKVTKTEATPDRVFERAAETYRYERSIGKDHTAANNAAETRISKTVDNNLILSARLAAQQTLVRVAEKDERVIGYRRIIHPELAHKTGTCGLCVAAANRIYKLKELQPIHGGCNCSISPVTTAHDPGYTLNEDDLNRLYEHAGGGTAGRGLKRINYQIIDHHELGPVLTKVTGEFVPYYSTVPPAAA
jgi:hypothetical protein